MKKLILTLLIVVLTMPILASVKIGDFYYELDEANLTASVTYEIYREANNYSGLSSVIIPEYVVDGSKTYSVTSIGDYAFYHSIGMNSIQLPNSITKIGDWSFFNCSGLTGVTIPNSVTSIGDYAFWYCRNLVSVDIPNSVTSLGHDAFRECFSLKIIGMSDSIIKINFNTFQDCSSLTSITIPNSVTSIGNNAFSGCSNLTKVEITDLEHWCNIQFENLEANPLYYTKKLYVNGEEITNLTIPESITEIKNFAFSGLNHLKSVKIPNTVTYIGDYAFWECKDMTSVEIPNSVTLIGSSAFYGCNELTSIVLGENIDTIGPEAFWGCNKIKQIFSLPLFPPSLQDKNTFSSVVYDSAILYVPASRIFLYQSRSFWGDFFNIKTLEESDVDEVGLDVSATHNDVFNLNGQLLKRNASQSDIDALNPGIYIIGGKKVIVR